MSANIPRAGQYLRVIVPSSTTFLIKSLMPSGLPLKLVPHPKSPRRSCPSAHWLLPACWAAAAAGPLPVPVLLLPRCPLRSPPPSLLMLPVLQLLPPHGVKPLALALACPLDSHCCCLSTTLCYFLSYCCSPVPLPACCWLSAGQQPLLPLAMGHPFPVNPPWSAADAMLCALCGVLLLLPLLYLQPLPLPAAPAWLTDTRCLRQQQHREGRSSACQARSIR